MEKPLTDEVFLSQIRRCTLPPEYFSHEGHLRLAWLLATTSSGASEASKQACLIIKKYASSLGAADKYHHTITEFLQRLVCDRQSRLQFTSWQSFLAANQDLILDCLSLLDQYYDNEVLFSDKAKSQYITPTKRGFFD